jgi:hypothetical protein
MKQTGFVVKNTSSAGNVFFTASSAYDRPRWVPLAEATVYTTENAADRAAAKIRTKNFLVGASVVPMTEAVTLLLPVPNDSEADNDVTTSVQSNVYAPVDPNDDGADVDPNAVDPTDDDCDMPPSCDVVGGLDPSCDGEGGGDSEGDTDSLSNGDGSAEVEVDADGEDLGEPEGSIDDEPMTIVLPMGESASDADRPRVHDLSELDDEEAYDETQTNDTIKDGDVIIVKHGVAVMYRAWPVLVAGHAEEFHRLNPGTSWATFNGGKYLAAAEMAQSIYKRTPDEEAADIVRAVKEAADHEMITRLVAEYDTWAKEKKLDPQSRITFTRFARERQLNPEQRSDLEGRVGVGSRARRNDEGLSDVVSAGTADGNGVVMSTSPTLSMNGFTDRLTGESLARKDRILGEMREHLNEGKFKMPKKPARDKRQDNDTTAATSKIPVKNIFGGKVQDVEQPEKFTQIASDMREKVSIPTQVTSDLSKTIDEYDELVKQGGNVDKVSYCMTVADALRELKACLDQRTVEGIQQAQIKYGSFSNLITMQIPPSVVKYITSGGRAASLRQLFDEYRTKDTK